MPVNSREVVKPRPLLMRGPESLCISNNEGKSLIDCDKRSSTSLETDRGMEARLCAARR
jgi:hypothetical protein